MPRPNRSRMPAAIDDIDAITPCPLSEPLPTQLGGGALDISITMDGACGSVAAVHGLADLDLGSASASTHAVTSRSSSPVSECASPTSSMTASCCSSSCSKKNTRSSSTSSAGSSSSRRRDSLRALEEGTDGDPERLWRRMLALQQIYGCYNSARMSAALSSGDASLLLRKSPPRFVSTSRPLAPFSFRCSYIQSLSPPNTLCSFKSMSRPTKREHDALAR